MADRQRAGEPGVLAARAVGDGRGHDHVGRRRAPARRPAPSRCRCRCRAAGGGRAARGCPSGTASRQPAPARPSGQVRRSASSVTRARYPHSRSAAGCGRPPRPARAPRRSAAAAAGGRRQVSATIRSARCMPLGAGARVRPAGRNGRAPRRTPLDHGSAGGRTSTVDRRRGPPARRPASPAQPAPIPRPRAPPEPVSRSRSRRPPSSRRVAGDVAGRAVELDRDQPEGLGRAELGGQEGGNRPAAPVERVVAAPDDRRAGAASTAARAAATVALRGVVGQVDAHGPARRRRRGPPAAPFGGRRPGGHGEHPGAPRARPAQRPLEGGHVGGGQPVRAGRRWAAPVSGSTSGRRSTHFRQARDHGASRPAEDDAVAAVGVASR